MVGDWTSGLKPMLKPKHIYWTYRQRVQRQLFQIPCETCGAEVGWPCKTRGGKPTVTPHMVRFRRAGQAANKDRNEGNNHDIE